MQGAGQTNTLVRQSDALASGVETVLNAAGEWIADACETPGNALHDWFDRLTRRSGALRRPARWLGGTISGTLDLAAAIVKAVVGLATGVCAGGVRMLGGGAGALLGGGTALLERGARDVLAGLGGALVMTVGKAIALVQTITLLQNPRRPLTSEEAASLDRVFRGSVALYNVRLVEGRSGIFGINGRPFTLGNTIFMKALVPADHASVVVHECTHVWQFQNVGARYAADALAAQGFVEDPYDWRREIARGKSSWSMFNKEAQAELLRDLYRMGSRGGRRPTGKGEFYDDDPPPEDARLVVEGADHTALARAALHTVRRRRTSRWSRRLRPHATPSSAT